VIDDLGKLLDRVSSPADLAVILLAGPLAYVLDAGLDVIGFLPPGYVAVAVSSVALGLKKVVEVRRTNSKQLASRQDARSRADALREHLESSGAPLSLLSYLDAEISLHTRGATTEAELESAVAGFLEDYRAWARAQRSDAGISGGER
jgi:hypothetical protein